MKSNLQRYWVVWGLAACVPLALLAADPAPKAPPTSIGLFEGMESGDIEVKVIPKDSTEGTITIANKTKKPLTIKLPEAFAGVPVLAQGGLLGGNGGGVGGGRNNNNNNQNQGMG